MLVGPARTSPRARQSGPVLDLAERAGLVVLTPKALSSRNGQRDRRVVWRPQASLAWGRDEWMLMGHRAWLRRRCRWPGGHH